MMERCSLSVIEIPWMRELEMSLGWFMVILEHKPWLGVERHAPNSSNPWAFLLCEAGRGAEELCGQHTLDAEVLSRAAGADVGRGEGTAEGGVGAAPTRRHR